MRGRLLRRTLRGRGRHFRRAYRRLHRRRVVAAPADWNNRRPAGRRIVAAVGWNGRFLRSGGLVRAVAADAVTMSVVAEKVAHKIVDPVAEHLLRVYRIAGDFADEIG